MWELLKKGVTLVHQMCAHFVCTDALLSKLHVVRRPDRGRYALIPDGFSYVCVVELVVVMQVLLARLVDLVYCSNS